MEKHTDLALPRALGSGANIHLLCAVLSEECPGVFFCVWVSTDFHVAK